MRFRMVREVAIRWKGEAVIFFGSNNLVNIYLVVIGFAISLPIKPISSVYIYPSTAALLKNMA